MFKVIPGILEKDWESIEKKIEIGRGFADAFHIDILDGEFTNNTSFLDPKPFAKYAKDLFFELHMMVEDPIQYLKPFAQAGFRRFLGHVEKMSDQEEFVAIGEQLGEVGLALDKETPIDAIRVPFNDLDMVLVMTIKAGFSGQAFTSELLKKVQDLREKTAIPLEVDGGINDISLIQARNAGATDFVSTSFIYKNPDPHFAFKTLLESCSLH
ncbi:MAG: hypothetical protein A3D75_01840 [Candidatus Levybacteria bacterium RIFCSPHIGHO2_02_FULL_37_18]|nr:MAG: hypothetical protein A2770_03190 [Candidatus Levybacteria bacterium RIFCSPHIGHO2_01_FULL_38_12]OGH22182.1 MAG: hypothetical protein A3D75_01840 [Candidatus Levybacteria bacterium RIFCSPHIGHO2_02_FULL_37_18]OGH34361.1 MAG: hypothetical protein A3A47_02090 [Candidatus Levybacteria bacterium RIFCSPLOWO2_01_FULL_37_20]OGH44243.1 MAG: hypothetical protein A3J14_01675 [Candidatus Levybacteria bacterium RIFCSPLOWO2_02_FULL_37_18]